MSSTIPAPPLLQLTATRSKQLYKLQAITTEVFVIILFALVIAPAVIAAAKTVAAAVNVVAISAAIKFYNAE